jgi:heme exporter protein C
VPLDVQIEKFDIVSKDSHQIQLKLYVPRLKQAVVQAYSYHPKFAESSLIQASKIEFAQDTLYVYMPNPNQFLGMRSKEFLQFEIVLEDKSSLIYPEWLYVDSVSGSKVKPLIPLPEVKNKKKNFVFPNREQLRQSIRNLFFHVPMWFAMIALLGFSFYHAIRFLVTGDSNHDEQSSIAVYIGIFFGFVGLFTGMVWAKYTWGDFWPKEDEKLNGAAVGMFIYMAYIVLRYSIPGKISYKISAVYNVVAFVLYLLFIFILPRLNDSLHPGNGGNPGFSIYDKTLLMRMVFYPAVLGWIGLGFAYLKIWRTLCFKPKE